MNKKYIKLLCEIINQKRKQSDKEIWQQLCIHFIQENHAKPKFCLSLMSKAYKKDLAIARYYAHNKESEQNLFHHLNIFYDQRNFNIDEKFSQLLQTFINFYPQYRYYLHNNIKANLPLTPYIPFDSYQIKFILNELMHVMTNYDAAIVQASLYTLSNMAATLSNAYQHEITNTLIDQLDDSEPYIQIAIVKSFVYFTPMINEHYQRLIVDTMIGKLSTDYKIIVDATADALVQLTPNLGNTLQQSIIAVFSTALRHSEIVTREIAAEALNKLSFLLSDDDKQLITHRLTLNIFYKHRYTTKATYQLATLDSPHAEQYQHFATSSLLHQFIGPDKLMRDAAAYTLLDIAAQLPSSYQQKMIPSLIITLNDLTWHRRFSAAKILAAIGSKLSQYHQEIIISLLIMQLDNTDQTIKITAANSLAIISIHLSDNYHSRITEALLLNLLDRNEEVIMAANNALIAISVKLSKELKQKIIQPLLETLKNYYSHFNQLMADALATITTDLSESQQHVLITTLFTWLSNPSLFIREMSLNAFASITFKLHPSHQKSVLDSLMNMLNNSDNWTRIATVKTLGAIFLKQTSHYQEFFIETLILAMHNDDYIIRKNIIDRLAKLTILLTKIQIDTLTVLLTHKLSDPNNHVRIAAINALTNLPFSQSQPLLIQLLIINLEKEPTTSVKKSIVHIIKKCIAITDESEREILFTMALPLLLEALKKNTGFPMWLAVTDIVQYFMKDMNDTQKNYFIYGKIFHEYLQDHLPSYTSTLMRLILVVCSTRAFDCHQKQCLQEHFSLPMMSIIL